MKNNKNSFILLRGGWPYVKNIEPLIAKNLKRETNLKLIMLTKTLQDKEFIEKHFHTYYDKILYKSTDIDDCNYRGKILLDGVEKEALKIEKIWNKLI